MAAPLRRSAAAAGSDRTTASPARKASSGAAPGRVCLGAIAAAHGIKGEVKIKTFTSEPLNIGSYGPVSDETGARSFRLTQLRAPGGAAGASVVIARIEGVSDRTGAEALRGLRLYVARDVLPAAEPGEYYHHDLIGLAVVLQSGERMGKVAALHNFGAGDLLEIERDGADSVMVPFTDSIVPIIDIPGGKVLIDPPDGLFDDGAADDKESPDDNPGAKGGKS